MAYPIRKQKKLTTDEVLYIYELLKEGKYTQSEIGKMFGLGQTTITAINNGKNYWQPNITYPIRSKPIRYRK